MDWPQQVGPSDRLVLSTAGVESVGPFMFAIAKQLSDAATWPTANKAIFVPFVVRRAFTVRQLAWWNGSAVSGNVDCGVYDEVGTKIVSAGSTAQSGTSAAQIVNVTDSLLPAGLYYAAMARDTTTGSTGCGQALNAAHARAVGAYCMTSAFPLPTTATFAAAADVHVPLIHIIGNAVF